MKNYIYGELDIKVEDVTLINGVRVRNKNVQLLMKKLAVATVNVY